jgi:hypothetical protein
VQRDPYENLKKLYTIFVQTLLGVINDMGPLLSKSKFCTLFFLISILSRDISVGIATGYGLEDGGVGVRVPVRQRF